MAIGGAFVELGRYLDECERGESTVTDVRLVGCDSDGGDGAVRADVDVRLSASQPARATGGLSVRDPRVGPDGTLRVVLESTDAVLPTTDDAIEVTASDTTLQSDGSLALTLSVTVPTTGTPADTADEEVTHHEALPDHGSTADVQTNDEPTTGETDADARAGPPDRDDSVPPFKNPELLREIYDSCGTFAEMADELDMDVTAETVRRYMIDFDIHQPRSYATNGDRTTDAEADDAGHASVRDDDGADDDGSTDGRVGGHTAAAASTDDRHTPERPTASADTGPEEPVVLSDGIGLPEEVTIETLIETVERSNTIYEVKRDVGVGREDALTMLRELNLLDLVTGRLATEAERDISRVEIVDRLREASATQ